MHDARMTRVSGGASRAFVHDLTLKEIRAALPAVEGDLERDPSGDGEPAYWRPGLVEEAPSTASGASRAIAYRVFRFRREGAAGRTADGRIRSIRGHVSRGALALV